MKDYYRILDVSEDASDEDIKKAFRKLALQHHPDKNIGKEKQAEEKFKEINEAYCILADKEKRQQYDLTRNSPFAGVSSNNVNGGFQYSQQDIFRSAFSNQSSFGDLSRLFTQAGLRFDEEFLNRVFFSGGGVGYHFSFGGRDARVNSFRNETTNQNGVVSSSYKPNILERWLNRMTVKLGKYALKKFFGIEKEESLDQHYELEVSDAEASIGGEKEVSYKRGMSIKKLMVRIPAGVTTGTKIRLKGMGKNKGNRSGDLYLHIRVTGG